MKRTLTLIALVAICSAMMVSCKNTKTAEPTPEEIQAQKVALADSVLAQIDVFAEQFFDASSKTFKAKEWKLTEAEKMVKPDYLLDPSVAATLVTKSQKVSALAIYCSELVLRKLYDMPLDETEEVIAKLAAEVNHPVELNFVSNFDMPASEVIREEYEACRERGDLPYFWQFQNALLTETSFILAQNPELFLSKITEEQWQSYYKKMHEKTLALMTLAQYDEEMMEVCLKIQKNRVSFSDDEYIESTSSIQASIEYYKDKKDKFIAKRNALLQ